MKRHSKSSSRICLLLKGDFSRQTLIDIVNRPNSSLQIMKLARRKREKKHFPTQVDHLPKRNPFCLRAISREEEETQPYQHNSKHWLLKQQPRGSARIRRSTLQSSEKLLPSPAEGPAAQIMRLRNKLKIKAMRRERQQQNHANCELVRSIIEQNDLRIKTKINQISQHYM